MIVIVIAIRRALQIKCMEVPFSLEIACIIPLAGCVRVVLLQNGSCPGKYLAMDVDNYDLNSRRGSITLIL